jgi:stage II sporulation protein D
MPHSKWEKSITRERWHLYLDSKRNEFSDTAHNSLFAGHMSRGLYYSADSTLKIPLRMMREDLKLRSTSFKLTSFGDEIVFVGNGFGHGVGLCQEGAMRMAQLDYCYEDIIHYYYKDVHLIPRYMMWFFKE